MFKVCKFLYEGKADLTHDKPIFQFYKSQLGQRLAGVKHLTNEESKKLYLANIWALANKKNLVSKGLAVRRSGVYTVMQNRFISKCYNYHGPYNVNAGRC